MTKEQNEIRIELAREQEPGRLLGTWEFAIFKNDEFRTRSGGYPSRTAAEQEAKEWVEYLTDYLA